MLYMVIERFKSAEAVPAVYRRLSEKGRMMPDGLRYVDSWVEGNFDRCFLVADCADPQLIEQWIPKWHDLVDFEVVPVLSSPEAATIAAALE